MSYDIQIVINSEQDHKYAPFLRNNEIVSGIENKVEFIVENKGEKFPGGIINEVIFRIDRGMGQLTQTYKENAIIPILEKNEKHSFEIIYQPMILGLCIIECKIVLDDKEKKITYYQDIREKPLDGDHYYQIIPIVDRLLLELLLYFQKFTKGNKKK